MRLSQPPESLRFLIFAGARGVGYVVVTKGQVQKVEWLVHFTGRWGLTNRALSPDGRWLYLAMHPETAVLDIKARKLHWLGRAKVDPDGAYTPEVYNPIWSPNSRYLLGNTGGDADDLVLCTPPRLGYRTLVKKGVIHLGWYPNSQQVWYTSHQQRHNSTQEVYHSLELSGKHARLLSALEVKKINTHWDFLCAAFRSPWSHPYWYFYTTDLQMRIKLPDSPPSNILVVEWRDGKRKVLQAPDKIKSAVPRGLSADKQWLLVEGIVNLYAPSTLEHLDYAVHLPKEQWVFLYYINRAEWLEEYGEIVCVEFTQSTRLLG